jgi:DNA polymerase-3 subunit gamma/tau
MRVELERAQHNLLEFLKRKLNNYDITIEITVNEAAERRYAYTTREKYEKLKEKNPDLEILRTTFDLDI